MREIKALRRGIIVICMIVLIPSLILDIPEGKYYDDELKSLVKEGRAQVIEINKKAKIDKDTFVAQRFITTSDTTYLRYSLIRLEEGWSFPGEAIEMIDDKNYYYDGLSGGSMGKIWGQDGLIKFERLEEGVEEVAIKIDWYDRNMEIKVPIQKEGVDNEDK